MCIGETIDQRKADETKKVVHTQIQKGLMGIDDISSLIIAYEPVWAIGTGHVATPEQAQEVHQFIRGMISERWSEKISSEMKILYGGSVKPDNASALWNMPDIDGFLIGGASLKADSFSTIAGAVKTAKPVSIK
jgi:triosephosphate isomerase